MCDWKKMRVVLSLCIALSWWGVWFPELAVWTEAVCVVDETGEQSYAWTAGEAAKQLQGRNAGEVAEQPYGRSEGEAAEQSHGRSAGEASEYKNAREIYHGLLHAQRDQIQIKSRLLQIIEKYF